MRVLMTQMSHRRQRPSNCLLARVRGNPPGATNASWIFGTFAAVAVVALLALVLQGALAGRGSTGPTNKSTGKWQILDKLTWKRTSAGQVLPSIAPTNPQVVYEATNLVNGAAETSKVVSVRQPAPHRGWRRILAEPAVALAG